MPSPALHERKLAGILAVILLATFIVVIPGYLWKEEAEVINVNLSKTQSGIIEITNHSSQNRVVYFGFDLRLNPKEDVRIYVPLMRYLSEKTGYTFKIRFTREYESTQENLGRGVTQFAILGPVSCIQAHRSYGVIPLVRGLNEEGRGEYQAAIFTRPDSKIKSIEDVKGHSFAFGPRDSTQGHLIPRKMLEDAGISLSSVQKYDYMESHKATAEAIISGRFDAGGMQDTLAKAMVREGRIRIVNFSRLYPGSGISANKDINPELIEAVKKALLELDPKGRHREILTGWEKTEMPSGFVEARYEDYAELEEIALKYGIVR